MPLLMQNSELTGLGGPVAFVLSGGAASGAVQVGMLRALAEAGVRPDLVVGTSVGAVNGVMVAADPVSGWEQLAEVWAQIDRAAVLGSNRSLRTWSCLMRTRRHLFETDSLQLLLRDNLPATTFDQLAVPFAAVVTNAATGTTELLGAGHLETALLASAAIPGAFPRVEIDGQMYFDGGVTANVPVRPAFELGAGTVVVLDSATELHEGEPPTTIAGTMQYVVGLMMRSQTSNVMEAERESRVIRLPLATPPGIGVFDFARTEELIDLGYEKTRAFLTEGTVLEEPLGEGDSRVSRGKSTISA